MAYPLSILDLAPIPAGATSRQALQAAVDLAVLAERLGYRRVWYAEHHNTAGLASAAPELLIAHVATQTSQIRLGSGGVMLPNHAPLRIVEAFRLLAALHPGRIDLGLGRAPGTDTITAYAMRRSVEALSGDDYPEQLAELLAFDDRSFPEGHPFREIEAVPHDVKLPPLWLLGSSGFSAQLAAGAGLGFAFAAHINGAGAIAALRTYRERFVPSARYPAPRAILTVAVAVGEDAAHARELARANDLLLLRLASGQRGGRPTLEEARRHRFTPAERALLASTPMRYLAGDAAGVREQIAALADEARADEVMITSFLAEPDDRRRAIAHLARAFGLQERPASGAREAQTVE